MGNLLNAELRQEIKVKAPADIVVAADVIEENELLRQIEHRVHLVFKEPDIPGRDRAPHCAHGRRVVEHLTFRLLDRAEIGSELGRLHDDFA